MSPEEKPRNLVSEHFSTLITIARFEERCFNVHRLSALQVLFVEIVWVVFESDQVAHLLQLWVIVLVKFVLSEEIKSVLPSYQVSPYLDVLEIDSLNYVQIF